MKMKKKNKIKKVLFYDKSHKYFQQFANINFKEILHRIK